MAVSTILKPLYSKHGDDGEMVKVFICTVVVVPVLGSCWNASDGAEVIGIIKGCKHHLTVKSCNKTSWGGSDGNATL